MEREKRNDGSECPACAAFAAEITAQARDRQRGYDAVLRLAIGLQRQGVLELFAGDCPLENTGAVLAAEEHYTVCHYLRCRRCGALWFVGACVRGEPICKRADDVQTADLRRMLWGRCGSCFSQGGQNEE